MYTTLEMIRAQHPCESGWKKLLRHLGKTQADEEPLNIATVLSHNGLDDALWSLRAVKGQDREIRLYAVWCARQVQHLTIDVRSANALDVAERFANGLASVEDLVQARFAAEEAALDEEGAARAAVQAARAAASEWPARAAWTAALDAARAAWEAEREVVEEAQSAKLREICQTAPQHDHATRLARPINILTAA